MIGCKGRENSRKKKHQQKIFRVYISSAALFQQDKTSQINLFLNIFFLYSLSDYRYHYWVCFLKKETVEVNSAPFEPWQHQVSFGEAIPECSAAAYNQLKKPQTTFFWTFLRTSGRVGEEWEVSHWVLQDNLKSGFWGLISVLASCCNWVRCFVRTRNRSLKPWILYNLLCWENQYGFS